MPCVFGIVEVLSGPIEFFGVANMAAMLAMFLVAIRARIRVETGNADAMA